MTNPALPEFSWVPLRVPKWTGPKKKVLWSIDKADVAGGRSQRMFVYSWGIAWIDGKDEGSVRWEGIDALYRDVTRTLSGGKHLDTTYFFTLRLADGRERKFGTVMRADDVAQSEAADIAAVPGKTIAITVEQLGRVLQAGVARVQLPKVTALLEAGQAASFGPYTVSVAGIAAGGKLLPWPEVGRVFAENGFLYIWRADKRGGLERCKVREIPNYAVLTTVLGALRAQREAP